MTPHDTQQQLDKEFEEELKLWRPVFYKDKISGKDIDELKLYLHRRDQAIIEAVKGKIKGRIGLRLEYCKAQNGLDYCKNCGLNEEDLSELK